MSEKERVRKIVDEAVVDVALCGPRLSAVNLRMLSGAIADRVVDQLFSPVVQAASEEDNREELR